MLNPNSSTECRVQYTEAPFANLQVKAVTVPTRGEESKKVFAQYDATNHEDLYVALQYAAFFASTRAQKMLVHAVPPIGKGDNKYAVLEVTEDLTEAYVNYPKQDYYAWEVSGDGTVKVVKIDIDATIVAFNPIERI